MNTPYYQLEVESLVCACMWAIRCGGTGPGSVITPWMKCEDTQLSLRSCVLSQGHTPQEDKVKQNEVKDCLKNDEELKISAPADMSKQE